MTLTIVIEPTTRFTIVFHDSENYKSAMENGGYASLSVRNQYDLLTFIKYGWKLLNISRITVEKHTDFTVLKTITIGKQFAKLSTQQGLADYILGEYAVK